MRLFLLLAIISYSHRSYPISIENCWKLAKEYFGPFKESVAYKTEANFNNYHIIAHDYYQNVLNELLTNKNEVFYDFLLNNRELLKDNFFQHIFQNTIQHGTQPPTNRYQIDYSKLITNLDLNASISKSGIKFEISNTKVKDFPSSLEGRYYAKDRIKTPIEERVGFKGTGRATPEIVSSLKELPPKSYVEWSTDQNKVTFTLYIHIKG